MFTSVRNALLLLGRSALVMLTVIGAASAQEPAVQPPATPAPAAPPPSPTPPEATPPAAAPPGTTTIPQVTVTAPKQAQRAAPARTTAGRPAVAPGPAAIVTAPRPNAPPIQTPAQAATAQRNQVIQRSETLDQRRADILPNTGVAATTKTQQDIENLPQGSNAQITDIVLQYPGVYQGSTSSGDFHVRNEHATGNSVSTDYCFRLAMCFEVALFAHVVGALALISAPEPPDYGVEGPVVTLDLPESLVTTVTPPTDLALGPKEEASEATPAPKQETKPPEPEAGGTAGGEAGNDASSLKGGPEIDRPVAEHACRAYRSIQTLSVRGACSQRTGVATVVFTMDRDGRVLTSQIVQSSGSPALDGEALQMLTRAQLMPKAPCDMQGMELSLAVPIRFNIR
jgi:TonB family protein